MSGIPTNAKELTTTNGIAHSRRSSRADSQLATKCVPFVASAAWRRSPVKPVPHLICYRETSVEEIAATVGLPASGVYRYFGRKSDLLAASFRRAADWLSTELGSVASAASDPEEALTRVIDAYVARSFDRPELDYLYYTERLNMTKADQNVLRIRQLSTVESWVELVTAARPGWAPGDARFADIGRLTGYRDTSEARELVGRLLDLTLLGRYRLRATLTAR